MLALHYDTHIDAESGKVTSFAPSRLCDYEYDSIITMHGTYKTYIKSNKSDPKGTCFSIAPYVPCSIVDEDLGYVEKIRDVPKIATLEDLISSSHAIVEPWSHLCDTRWKSSYSHIVFWLPDENRAIVYYGIGPTVVKNLPKTFATRVVTMKMFGVEYQMTCVADDVEKLNSVPVPDGWKLIKDTVVMVEKQGLDKVLTVYGDYVKNNISGTYAKVEQAYTVGKTIVWIPWLKKFILLHKHIVASDFPKLFKVAEVAFSEKAQVNIHIIYDDVESVKSFTMKPFKKNPTIRYLN